MKKNKFSGKILVKRGFNWLRALKKITTKILRNEENGRNEIP
jgi:hypothetical protein